MVKFFGFLSSSERLLADTSLSRFVRDASSAEKKKVYSRVIARATEDQNKVIELAKNLESQKVSIGVRSRLFEDKRAERLFCRLRALKRSRCLFCRKQWDPARPSSTVNSGFRHFCPQWYLANPEWVGNVQSGAYKDWVSKQYAGG